MQSMWPVETCQMPSWSCFGKTCPTSIRSSDQLQLTSLSLLKLFPRSLAICLAPSCQLKHKKASFLASAPSSSTLPSALPR
ncbi:hypothetical protein O181_065380 [Austropuccinia psidii MF-1]|uniref:Uncharacterized protein n=1 Tax=Austropuccinia psidii MF-1 TaxID=1389203 RepID=A0A9Q3EUZ0_9BASI|nr:hypothetical protein [Austropuccinia psidii MF-1]